MENEKRTYTIKAPTDVLERFERFMTMLYSAGRSGHSGTFAMSFDGDGCEFFNVDDVNIDKYIKGAQRVASVGYHVEISNRNGFSGVDMNLDKVSNWHFNDAGESTDVNDILYAYKKIDPPIPTKL